MYIGVDYYPEHWPKARWETDARMMQKAGFNIVRLAEFAWVNMEPVEGQFDFAWLDEALAVLGKHGISAILGTPTAVMPAWVARKYPETLAMQKDGQRIVWGVRKNNCFSSGAYRMLSSRITAAMGSHFARTPNVIGWQTDNEFGHPFCYCPTCRQEFQDFLRRKYGTLDELNRAWGTHFWGHRYGRWDEIPLPVDYGSHNPSACLDFQRFTSFLNVRFQAEQVQILRKLAPKHFITHNFMGLFKELNYFDLAKDLDLVAWDNYPIWGKPEPRFGASMAADLMRGLKRKNFWIMEQTAGPGGWGAFGRNPYPGEIRSVAYQQLAHGADGQIWFRWRTCTAGREQYWHGLLQHDGKANRRYKEAAQVAKEYHQLAKVLVGTTVKTPVAIVYDYESYWATEIQRGYQENDYPRVVQRYYEALVRAGVNVDMVPPSADLTAYKLVLAPNLYILPDAVARKLVEFVKAGGVLLADCRTGVKDETSLCHERTLPGLLSEALGVEIPEYDTLHAELAYPIVGGAAFPGTFTAMHYMDWVTPTTAEKLAGYENWHIKDYAAVTRNAFGKGRGWYVGVIAKEAAFYDQVIAGLLKDARIRPVVKPAAGVEVSVRQGAGKRLLFLINHTDQPVATPVPVGKVELLTGRKTQEVLKLGRHGVAVVRL